MSGAGDGGGGHARSELAASNAAAAATKAKQAWGVESDGSGGASGAGVDASGTGGGASGGGSDGETDVAAWLSVLNEPEAALAAFRAQHWEPRKAAARDDLKRRLHEAYSGAKEAGELVARKRGSVHELKTALQEVESASLGGGPGGNEAGEAGRERIERLRAQLLDTTLYKGAAELRELKAEIEAARGAQAEPGGAAGRLPEMARPRARRSQGAPGRARWWWRRRPW